jgi:hypothetical protein
MSNWSRQRLINKKQYNTIRKQQKTRFGRVDENELGDTMEITYTKSVQGQSFACKLETKKSPWLKTVSSFSKSGSSFKIWFSMLLPRPQIVRITMAWTVYYNCSWMSGPGKRIVFINWSHWLWLLDSRWITALTDHYKYRLWTVTAQLVDVVRSFSISAPSSRWLKKFSDPSSSLLTNTRDLTHSLCNIQC